MKAVSPTLLFISLALAGLSAAQPPSIPVQSADGSYVPNPPPPIEPRMKGYGTRAVEGQTLSEMLEKCRSQAAARNAVEQARCDQLLRTLKNQPGNSAGAS